MGLFDGKVALVTGAGRGIGRSESLLLASEGAKVVVNDLGGSGSGEGADSTPAQEVVDEIVAAGGEAVANYDDCSSWAGGEAMVQQAVDTFGSIDVLICNAGILRDKMSFNMSEEEFDAVIRVHLKGHFAPIRFASSYWRTKAKESGEPANAAIVTTASESGLYGNAGQTNYAAAKAGIASMTIVLARELERSGVRVNSIAPVAATRLLGTVATPELTDNPMMSPDNPAAGAVWLASPLADGITGQVLKISGGVAQIVDGWRPVTQISSTEKWTIQDLADGRNRLFKDRDHGVPSARPSPRATARSTMVSVNASRSVQNSRFICATSSDAAAAAMIVRANPPPSSDDTLSTIDWASAVRSPTSEPVSGTGTSCSLRSAAAAATSAAFVGHRR